MRDQRPCMCGCGQLASKSQMGLYLCSGHHMRVLYRGQNHPRWKGGRRREGRYMAVYSPGHHRQNRSNGHVLEHVLVAERALGKPISSYHPIHHVNGNSLDNRPCNLVICENAAYHTLLHRRMKALRAGLPLPPYPAKQKTSKTASKAKPKTVKRRERFVLPVPWWKRTPAPAEAK